MHVWVCNMCCGYGFISLILRSKIRHFFIDQKQSQSKSNLYQWETNKKTKCIQYFMFQSIHGTMSVALPLYYMVSQNTTINESFFIISFVSFSFFSSSIPSPSFSFHIKSKCSFYFENLCSQ